MKQPLWKKCLSYLIELHVESLESDLNEELHVSLIRGRYQLCTKNAVHSFDDLYVNFNEAFRNLRIENRKIENVLILGLGLGSIPFMLEKKFQLEAKYTAVELDEAVIYLADKYSLYDFKSPIDYICTDAESFVHINEGKYDLICMDVFVDDVIPSQFETKEYLLALRDRLAFDGILLLNRLATFKSDIEKTTDYNEKIFKDVFPNGYHYDIDGNWILIGELIH